MLIEIIFLFFPTYEKSISEVLLCSSVKPRLYRFIQQLYKAHVCICILVTLNVIHRTIHREICIRIKHYFAYLFFFFFFLNRSLKQSAFTIRIRVNIRRNSTTRYKGLKYARWTVPLPFYNFPSKFVSY